MSYPAYTPRTDSSSALNSNLLPPAEARSESGLSATGSISRGIQVSSNASVALQSSMYLKIKGSLSDNYMVSGVLTDKTSPLQPIGNTRRLNDFDRVLIRIDGPDLNASIGDLDLQLNNGRFGHTRRSIEGLNIEGRSGKITAKTALGFSYGKYHLQQIEGKDGKQGPYRLTGKNGEKFIIVLAGSENVKLDDRLMQRGAEDDYIIDYNAAEISFTQKHILSSNSRISVEYEYVPDIYLASYSFGKQLLSGGISYGERDASPFYLSASWQQFKDDQRNPLGAIDSDQLESIFNGLADTVETTWVSGVNHDSLNGEYNLNTEDVLVYVGPGLGDYSVTFTFVGESSGIYRKEIGTAGDFFVHDTLKGEYLPAQRYIAPQSNTVLSITGQAQKGILGVNLDLGISNSIKNLYASQIDSPHRLGWDANLNANGKILALRLGDKHYAGGFVTHDAVETNEYYRKWQITPRIEEEEHLNYATFRLGRMDRNYARGTTSRLTRDGSVKGEQLQFEGGTAPHAPVSLRVASSITSHANQVSQQHALKTDLKVGKVTGNLNLDIEDAATTSLYTSNDHVSMGAGLGYAWSDVHNLVLSYNNRQDYRFTNAAESFLAVSKLSEWTDQRHDWASEYAFAEFLNSEGLVKLKYREHLNDSTQMTRYYLGDIEMKGKAWDDRIKFMEKYVIDEEHIPRYEYHYLEVDTGYGNYSYDPLILDYIPTPGGRFIRQRAYSDFEEQVRKYEHKTRIDFKTLEYGKPGVRGFKSRLDLETRRKLQVNSDAEIQGNVLQSLHLNYLTGKITSLTRFNYTGKTTDNSSALYNYGKEENQFVSHTLDGELILNPQHSSKLSIIYEERQRQVEYNTLAAEDWRSIRPNLEHSYTINPQQRVKLMLRYSQVEDLYQDKVYTEEYLGADYNLSLNRRGRLDQKVILSRIHAEVEGIPYSVFSGRQPGENWKYTLNGRYTFSSIFQVSLNYSLQKRGDNQAEQFMRVEARTHF